MSSALITTTKELPLIRQGFPWTISMEFTAAVSGAVFPAGSTYEARYRARSSGSVLVTGAVTRNSDSVITITLTTANIAALVAALTFAPDGLFDVASVLLEIVRTDISPNEATGIIIQHVVVK